MPHITNPPDDPVNVALALGEIYRSLTDSVFMTTEEDINRFTYSFNDAIWTLDSFNVPAGTTGHPQSRSIRGYMYPHVIMRGIIPDMNVIYPAISSLYLGFEQGADIVYGAAFFISGGDPQELVVRVAGEGIGLWSPLTPTISLDITALAPDDWLTNEHSYSVKVNRNNTEFYIDGVLKAVIVSFPSAVNTRISQNNYPYAVGVTPYNPPKAMQTLIEAVVSNPLTDYSINFPAAAFRFERGDPCPPRVYPLYEWETEDLFTASTITALESNLTSHPFPIFSYNKKTIGFRASEQGTLSVELWDQTDNWRESDKMGVTKDKLKTYLIEEDGILARVVYTPNTYPCTISKAEVNLE